MALGRVGGILKRKRLLGCGATPNSSPFVLRTYRRVANIQLDVCSPNFLIQESIGKLDGFHAEILKKLIEWSDGFIIPSKEPGLGVELDETVAGSRIHPERIKHFHAKATREDATLNFLHDELDSIKSETQAPLRVRSG